MDWLQRKERSMIAVQVTKQRCFFVVSREQRRGEVPFARYKSHRQASVLAQVLPTIAVIDCLTPLLHPIPMRAAAQSALQLHQRAERTSPKAVLLMLQMSVVSRTADGVPRR